MRYTEKDGSPVPPAYGPYAVMVRDAEGTITVPWRGNYKAAAYRQSHKYSPAKTGNYSQHAMVVPPGMTEEEAAEALASLAQYHVRPADPEQPQYEDEMAGWRMFVIANGRPMHVTSVTAGTRALWADVARNSFGDVQVWEEGPTVAFLLASSDGRETA
jgi:hypothetical protein